MREVSSRHLVSCPECGFQCAHAKIIPHLKRCQKALQANLKNQQEQQQSSSALSPAGALLTNQDKDFLPSSKTTSMPAPQGTDKSSASPPSPIKVRVKDIKKLVGGNEAEQAQPTAELKKHESDLVKKVFMKKLEAEKPWAGTSSPEPQVLIRFFSVQGQYVEKKVGTFRINLEW